MLYPPQNFQSANSDTDKDAEIDAIEELINDLRSEPDVKPKQNVQQPTVSEKLPEPIAEPHTFIADKLPSPCMLIKSKTVYGGVYIGADADGSADDDEATQQLVVDEQPPAVTVDAASLNSDPHVDDELEYAEEEYIISDDADMPTAEEVDGCIGVEETAAAVSSMNNDEIESADEETIEEEHLADDATDVNDEEYFASVYQKPKRVKRDPVPFDTTPYCDKCDKSFSTRTNLLRHLQTHDGVKPYNCHICGNGKKRVVAQQAIDVKLFILFVPPHHHCRFHAERFAEVTHADTHGRASVSMLVLWSRIYAGQIVNVPYAATHRRETVPM